MAATDYIWGSYPASGLDVGIKNMTGSAMTAGLLVKLDTSNPLAAGQMGVAVVLTSAITDFADGFLVDNVPAGCQGRLRIEGVAVGVAAGAITIGAILGASATSGNVTTYTATNPSIGKAWSAAANALDPILVRIAPSRNA